MELSEKRWKRRDFLMRSAGAATAAVWAGSWTANADAARDWPRDLSSHRIAKIEAWRSNDRYTRSLGPNANSGPKGRGYGRQFRTVTTDKGAVGFRMSWAPDDQVAKFVGTKVGDLFDPDIGTDRELTAPSLKATYPYP